MKWPYGRATANETESQRYTFDELGRLTKYEQGKWTASSFTTPLTASHDWTLDEQGNWRKHKDETVTTEWELSVDPVNAYTQWKGWYDLDGNGTNETQGPLTLQYDGVKSFLYERELNPAVSPHPRRALRYLHDGLGRLTRIDKDVGGTITTLVSYGYDTQNRLAWRKEGSSDRVWLIYDRSRVIAEQTDTTRLKSYVWAGSQLILSRDQGGLELHHHQDRLGSVVLSTRKNGSTTELHGRAQFDPYGRKVKQVGWEANGLGTVYGYAGMRLDDTAKLYVMGHRWYDPEMGRFIEQDPIGESGGYNLYAYVNASPVMWVDPKGLRAEYSSSSASGWSSKGSRGLGDGLRDANNDGFGIAPRGRPPGGCYGGSGYRPMGKTAEVTIDEADTGDASEGQAEAGNQAAGGEGEAPANDATASEATTPAVEESKAPDQDPKASTKKKTGPNVLVLSASEKSDAASRNAESQLGSPLVQNSLFAAFLTITGSKEKAGELSAKANAIPVRVVDPRRMPEGEARGLFSAEEGAIFINFSQFFDYDTGELKNPLELAAVWAHEVGHGLAKDLGVKDCNGCGEFADYLESMYRVNNSWESARTSDVGDLAHVPFAYEGLRVQYTFLWHANESLGQSNGGYVASSIGIEHVGEEGW